MASQGPFGHGHGSESAFGSESCCRLQRRWLRRVIKSDSCFQRTGHTEVDVQISWSPPLPLLAFTHLSVLSCNLSAVIPICSCLWPATKAYLLVVESSEFVYKWSKLGVEIQHHHNHSSHIPLSPVPSLFPVRFTGFTLLNVWTVPTWAFDLFTLRRGPLFFLEKKTWLPSLHLNRRSLGSSSRGVKKRNKLLQVALRRGPPDNPRQEDRTGIQTYFSWSQYRVRTWDTRTLNSSRGILCVTAWRISRLPNEDWETRR